MSAIAIDVIELIHQVSGTSVQTYSQDIIENHINKVFNMLHQKLWWSEYMRWASPVLDESTGVVTSNLVTAPEYMRWRDIRIIVPDGQRDAIPRLPMHVNPYELSGTVPLYVEPLNISDANFLTRVFKVWPLTATGTLRVHYRFRETENLATSSEVYMDNDLIVFGAVWAYLKDDGTFPEMTDEYKSLFDMRYKDVLKGDGRLQTEGRYLNQHQGSGGIPTMWFEDSI